jgi:hypothetical protein
MRVDRVRRSWEISEERNIPVERLLSVREIMELAKEHRMLERWEQVQQQARSLCGEQAHKVDVVAKREWDKEDSATTCHVTISDKYDTILWQNGNMEPEDDFEEFLDDEMDSVDDEGLYAEVIDHLNKLDRDEIDSTVSSASPALKLFPPITETYWLDKPPALSFPTVYLKEGATYRHELSRKEFMMLAEMYREFHHREKVYTLVRSTYGEKACSAVVTLSSPYGDNAGHYTRTNPKLAGVFDKDGNRLEPDLSLADWREGGALKLLQRYVYKQWVRSAGYVEYDLLQRTWLEAAHYAINEMLYRKGVFAATTCDFAMPPVMPPEVYTDVG